MQALCNPRPAGNTSRPSSFGEAGTRWSVASHRNAFTFVCPCTATLQNERDKEEGDKEEGAKEEGGDPIKDSQAANVCEHVSCSRQRARGSGWSIVLR
jgi:hypothetical protein